jgi:hypothetical protein
MTMQVFVSYTRPDHQLASKLATQLSLPAGNDIKAFIDDQLKSGLAFAPSLTRRISSADWFILVYTQGEDKRYEYPMFEAGQYFDSHDLIEPVDAGGEFSQRASDNKTDGQATIARRTRPEGRFCCLFDTKDIPEVFRAYQSYRIFSFNSEEGEKFQKLHGIQTEEDFYEQVPLQKFLLDFYATPKGAGPIYPNYDTSSNRNQRILIAKTICEAFDANAFDKMINERVLQHRIDVCITPDLRRSGKPNFDEMLLLGQDESLRLFGLATTSDLKWKDLRQVFVELGRPSPWMDEMELTMAAILGRRPLPTPMDISFTIPTEQGITRTFRPVLARFQQFQRGSFNFFISLYESKYRLLTDADLLISGIIMGSRFKELIADVQIFEANLKGAALSSTARSIRRRLLLIEAEAFELGLTNPAKLTNAMNAEHKGQVGEFFSESRSKKKGFMMKGLGVSGGAA